MECYYLLSTSCVVPNLVLITNSEVASGVPSTLQVRAATSQLTSQWTPWFPRHLLPSMCSPNWEQQVGCEMRDDSFLPSGQTC